MRRIIADYGLESELRRKENRGGAYMEQGFLRVSFLPLKRSL